VQLIAQRMGPAHVAQSIARYAPDVTNQPANFTNIRAMVEGGRGAPVACV